MTGEEIMLKDAMNKIFILQRDNERMKIRLEMFDDLKMVLTAQVNNGAERRVMSGAEEDIGWRIMQYLKSKEEQREQAKQQQFAEPQATAQ